MRALAVPLALTIAAFAGYCGLMVAAHLRRAAGVRDRQRATWQTHHHNVDGVTVVLVRLVTPRLRVLDSQVVARIPPGVSDWHARFLGARQEAEERVFHLRTGQADELPARRLDRRH